MANKAAPLPEGASWSTLAGVGFFSGIGFMMCLLIGTLAFDTSQYAARIRLGVLGGSLTASVFGLGILWLTLTKQKAQPEPASDG